MKSYKELLVWQKAMNLVKDIYNYTSAFPKHEEFCLTNQIRRSSISIPSNIAEGFGRKTKKDFISFLTITRGSLFELSTQIDISAMLDFISVENHKSLSDKADEIGK